MPRKPQKSPDRRAEHPIRRVRYAVAMSLDGYIAGPKEEADWIIIDPEEIDFNDLYGQFDTMLMGRRTFEWVKGAGGGGSQSGMQVYVCSRTLRQEDHPDVTITAEPQVVITELQTKPGKDLWLFGGGLLFRSLLEARLVDAVEVAVIPVLLGGGIPLLPSPAKQVKLKLTGHKVYSKTGTVSLEYAVQYGTGSKRPK
jgi:dihydrofolate reductase